MSTDVIGPSRPKTGDKVWLKVGNTWQKDWETGDKVWLKVGNTWQKDWVVHAIGVMSKEGYPFDVIIKRTNGKTRTMSPFDEKEIVFFPPSDEVPTDLKEWLEPHRDLALVRDVVNADAPHYSFLCTTCMQILYARISSVECASFTWRGKFYEGKPSVDECGTTLVCGCEREYEEPEETDRWQ